jgi:serine/threonine-protein kinase
MIGQTLGHYCVVEKIGEGGMGVVYRARDTRLDRDVALKVLPAGTLADEVARKRFRKEALALAKLSHPNIATIHDFDTEEGVDFLVTEYIPGVTLSEKLAAGSLPLREIAHLGIQLAEGLAAAHERGIVHGDLKPGNLLVTSDRRLKILDFGMAKLLHPEGPDATPTITETRAITGTLPYMSPEQLGGERPDPRNDIYSAGAVLYEMATGRRPFPEVRGLRLMDSILHQAPQAPSALNRRVSPALENIILKCLEKEPERRYQSARELRVDLERLGAPAPLVAAETGRRPALAQRWPLVLAGALVILLAVLLGLNVGGLRKRLLGRAGVSRIQSLAVLPLENLSRDPQQDYFAEGMTDALIANLSRISALRVISRTSAMRYKGTREPLSKIARQLNVEAVVEGSVLQSGNRVRIIAQLIDAEADRNLWSDEYERDLQDVLTLQNDVAQAIAREINIKLKPLEQAHLATRRTVNPEAYQLYLKGRYYWNKRTEDGVKKATDYFKQALEQDPSYALAYAGLADCYVILAGYNLLPPKEAYPLAEASAKKALQLDDTLAEAHTPLASFKEDYEWDWRGGLEEYRRAIELNPGYATAHQWYAEALMRLGRYEEAIAEIERAEQLDPLSLVIHAVHGYVYYHARQYDPAVAQFQKTLDLDANFFPAYLFLGWTYEQKGMYGEAVAQLQKAMALPGGDTAEVVAALGHAYAVSGEKARAAQLLSQLKQEAKRRYVDPYQIALVYAGLGEKDRAFASLEEAYRARSEGLTFLKVDPRLDALRSDLRCRDLLRRMHFPE